MPLLEEEFNFGKSVRQKSSEELLRSLEEMYTQTAQEVNFKTDLVVRGPVPLATDNQFRVGTIWIARDPAPDEVYILTDGANDVASWIQIG
jgi:hypothetical protein